MPAGSSYHDPACRPRQLLPGGAERLSCPPMTHFFPNAAGPRPRGRTPAPGPTCRSRSSSTTAFTRRRSGTSAGGVLFLDRPVPEMTALRIEFDLPMEAGGGSRARGRSFAARRSRCRSTTTRSRFSSTTGARSRDDRGLRQGRRPERSLRPWPQLDIRGTPARSSCTTASGPARSGARAACKWPSSTSRRCARERSAPARRAPAPSDRVAPRVERERGCALSPSSRPSASPGST